MRLGAVILLLLLTCALPAGAAPIRIMPLGDSITKGAFSSDLGGYRNRLRNRLTSAGWDVDLVGSQTYGQFPDNQHEGVEGAKIRWMAENHAPWSQVYDPQVTLVMIGTNDIWTGTGPDAPANAPANLNWLVERVFQFNPDTQLYVSSILPMYQGGSPTEDPLAVWYNQHIPAIVDAWRARGKSIRFVDMYAHFSRTDLADGIHPSDAGYAKMADVWFDALTTPLPPVDELSIKHRRGALYTATVPEPGGAVIAVVLGAVTALRRRAAHSTTKLSRCTTSS